VIPRFELIEEIEGWGTLVALVGGPLHGYQVLLVPRDRILPGTGRRTPAAPHATPSRQRTAARDVESKAQRLLESLLDARQLESWRSRRRFKVRTPYGYVELGRLYELVFQRNDGENFLVCVVPEGHRELPHADIWTNLVLALRSDPDRFFQVANYKGKHGWQAGPVPLSGRRR
jgi:hypothetical protein